MTRELYERVNAAVQRGQVWRAKELLRGNIGSGSYDSPLYERYGQLLLDLGEAHEAGKYLFLSGRRRPEFDEAIKVYLSRHPQDRPEVLYYSFPSAARFRQISRYPLAVRRVLEERGLPQYFARLEQERVERARANREFERMGGRTDRARLRWEYARLPAQHGCLGTWARYEPGLRHTPAQWAFRVLLQGFLSAVLLLLLASTVVGVVVIVRWIVSLI